MIASYIYFIQADDSGPIKIGFTTRNPRARLRNIQTGCPWPVRLLGVIRGTSAEEKSLHLRLAKWRTAGEWFEPSATVVATVKEALAKSEPIALEFKPWVPKYDHPLCIWLARHRIRAIEFARMVGVTPGAITGMYRDGLWLSRELARKIYDATNGEVTPTDFLLWEPAAKEQEAA